MLKTLVACLIAFELFVLPGPARARVEFLFSSQGIVFPTDPVNCPDPFTGCPLTAVGTATPNAANVSPLPGPWDFTAMFAIVAPLSATTFATTGVFTFDDPSPANDDFSGLLDGVLDVTSFTNTMSYTVTSGSGLFAAGTGLGSSVIQIIPQGPNAPFAFVERGAFAIPEPASLTLLGAALCCLVASRRRRDVSAN